MIALVPRIGLMKFETTKPRHSTKYLERNAPQPRPSFLPPFFLSFFPSLGHVEFLLSQCGQDEEVRGPAAGEGAKTIEKQIQKGAGDSREEILKTVLNPPRCQPRSHTYNGHMHAPS